MTIEYLGNKSQLLDFVVGPILAEPGVETVADVFCGTASVSRALAESGRRVIANDQLQLCATLAEAELLAQTAPVFEGVRHAAAARPGEPVYAAVMRTLNDLAPVGGFFHRTYSPASGKEGATRMYLTEENAGKVDAIREQLGTWEPLLTRAERAILLRDLVRAVARVSNTAGTYGCYLKKWKPRATEPLVMVPLFRAELPRRAHEVHRTDALAVASSVEVDAIYLDPPYTKRQYAAYYHLLETLVRGDEPDVTGSTGLPRWQDMRSDFCYARRAASALRDVLVHARAKHIFLSYSDDGHISHESILQMTGALGSVQWWETALRRYRSNGLGRNGGFVVERLYHVNVRS